MYRFDPSKGAVCDERGNDVLVESDWTIDKELYAEFRHGDLSWRIIAVLGDVLDPSGRVRLGWSVVLIAPSHGSAEVAAPTDAVAQALRAFGYGRGRGHDDDVPVEFRAGPHRGVWVAEGP